jgi:hypothetical protein
MYWLQQHLNQPTMLSAAHSFFVSLVSAALAATLRHISQRHAVLAVSTQANVSEFSSGDGPAIALAPEHKNTKNLLKRVSNLKRNPPAAGQMRRCAPRYLQKKHICSLHLLGARPSRVSRGC